MVRRIRSGIIVGFAVVASIASTPAASAADAEISISIDRFATLAPDGSIEFTVWVSCSLPGTEDFREGLAGASQRRTGAAAEGGLSPDVVCDGVERQYTAGISVITDASFERGPALARATVFGCNMVGDEQVCVHGSAERRVIVRGAAR